MMTTFYVAQHTEIIHTHHFSPWLGGSKKMAMNVYDRGDMMGECV